MKKINYVSFENIKDLILRIKSLITSHTNNNDIHITKNERTHWNSALTTIPTHTHPKSQITDFPTSLKNPNSLNISLNDVSQGSYDGSASKTFNITAANIGAADIEHSHNYLPLTGGTVTGNIYLNQGINCFSSSGLSGSGGYILMAQIKISGNYQNVPVVFEIANRNAQQSMHLSIQFASENNLDPTLQSLTYYGANIGAYVCKSSTGTWDLYIKKSESYDNIVVYNVSKHYAYMNKTTIVWKGIQISDLPTEFVKATLLLVASSANSSTKLSTSRKIGNANFDGTDNITLSQIGAATTEQVNQLQEVVNHITASHAIDGGDLTDNGPAENVYDGGNL